MVLPRPVLWALGPLAGLLFVYGLFALLTHWRGEGTFTTVSNLETIARQTTIVGTGAIGMTLVIIAGGIDLSVGSIIALSTVVIAALLDAGLPPLWAALAGVLAGAGCGLVNGALIAYVRVVPFIVTLGTMLVVRGLAKYLAHEQKIDAPLTWLADLVASLPPGQRWMLFPPGVWFMLVLAGLVAAILRFARIGRHIFAIGSSEQTARLCGVRVERTKVLVYAVCAGFAGMAGVMQFSRLTVGDPTVAAGAELDVIAAVVIGGGSLSGGEGSILGSLVGALIMTVIATGCSHLGLPTWVQQIVTGAIIVLAVTLDRLRHRRRS